MFKKILKKNKWVTLLELMLSMAIFSMIMIIVMSSVQSMMAGRIKAMNRIALTDELYFFAEQLFTEIKNGGTLDYEEYWNRKMVGTNSVDGSYEEPTGLGNYGKEGDINNGTYWKNLYYCRSKNASPMGFLGCTDANFNTYNDGNSGESQNDTFQRYGQYALQFWDYNANHNNDGGDENIIGDEDDRNLYRGPKVFGNQTTNPVRELYLINDKNAKNPTRTLFRWKIIPDPNRPTGTNCNPQKIGNIFVAWDNCIWVLQILKLNGHDLGLRHSINTADVTLYDGQIDTWLCESGWNCQWPSISGMQNIGKIATWQDEEWINLFPNSITVRRFQIEAYPERDPWLAAAEPDCDSTDTSCISPFIHPYVRVSLEIGFSHGKRRALRGENPTISLQTTINLDDFRTGVR